MERDVARVYGHKVRVRACGICVSENGLLMVNHHGITPSNFWAPPGGGVEFGNTIAETLKREFLEETGLEIEAGRFLFGCEYIHDPIHAIEVFYEVRPIGGKLKRGKDPEIQIITEVRYMSFREVKELPVKEVHGIFRFTERVEDLEKLTGFYSI
jgi:8-oxo-dGTP diphosphatase